MSGIKRPPQGQNTQGKKDSKAAKQDAKAEKGYEAVFDDIDDDYDDGGSSESDAESDGDAGEQTSTRTTRKGRVITKNKKKLNRNALLKQQRREQLARQAQGQSAASTQRNVGVKRTRMRNDNDEDELNDDFDDFGGGNIDLGDFSGGGSGAQDDQESGDHATEDWAEQSEIFEENMPSSFDASQMSENNQKAAEIFREFLAKQNDALHKSEKERLKKMLESMFQQCIKGLHHFPRESRKHQSLGKSANICKHALSALARDNIEDVKKLVSIITPKKRGL